MAYKSKKPKKESPQLAFLRKQREEECTRGKNNHNRGTKYHRGNR